MKININKTIFNLYSFLFIYTMINREFLFFGLDLRYIVLILGILLLFFKALNLIKNPEYLKKKEKKDIIYQILIALFIWSLISNISWLWNGLEAFPTQILNQNILLLNNLIAIIVYKNFKIFIKEEKIKKQIIFSCIVLVVSFILVGMGYSLSQISGSDVRSMVYALTSVSEHKNIFGGGFRIAGYAEDPNYASLFLILGVVTVLQMNYKKFTKFFLLISFLISFGFSCSKTIILSFLIALIYSFAITYFKKKGLPKIINFLFAITIGMIVIILPNSGLLGSHLTMTTRFKMWNMARDMFIQSPLIGNGINSFKSYIESVYPGWYVQAHSTYWQLLSETGLIGFLIFILLIVESLNNNKLSKYNKYLIFIFFIFVVNFETLQLQIFVYIIYVLSIFDDKKENGEIYEE